MVLPGVVLAILAGSFFVGRYLPPRLFPPVEEKPLATYRGVTASLYDEGTLRWVLSVDKVEALRDGHTVRFEGLTQARYEGEKPMSIEVRGGKGFYDTRARRLVVSGPVVVRRSDGLEVRCTGPVWDSRAERLWSQGDVFVQHEGSRIRGRNLVISMEDESVELEDVEAHIPLSAILGEEGEGGEAS